MLEGVLGRRRGHGAGNKQARLTPSNPAAAGNEIDAHGLSGKGREIPSAVAEPRCHGPLEKYRRRRAVARDPNLRSHTGLGRAVGERELGLGGDLQIVGKARGLWRRKRDLLHAAEIDLGRIGEPARSRWCRGRLGGTDFDALDGRRRAFTTRDGRGIAKGQSNPIFPEGQGGRGQREVIGRAILADINSGDWLLVGEDRKLLARRHGSHDNRHLQISQCFSSGAVTVRVERKSERGRRPGDVRHAGRTVLLTQDPRALPTSVDELVEIDATGGKDHPAAQMQNRVYAAGEQVVGQALAGHVDLAGRGGRGLGGGNHAARSCVPDVSRRLSACQGEAEQGERSGSDGRG